MVFLFNLLSLGVLANVFDLFTFFKKLLIYLGLKLLFSCFISNNSTYCMWNFSSLLPCACVCIFVLVAQLYLTLCNPMAFSSLPGSSVHRILQTRILEWVAIAFSRGSSWPGDQTQVSCLVGCFFNSEPYYIPLFCIN